ncbi:MAG: MFS transporter [Chloroflexota bacterium]|nr:MFS transporter [Chloroflexota bacterium]
MNKETVSATEGRSAPATLPMPHLVALAIGARVVIDTGIQIFGPYLSIIAAGLGTSIVTLGWMNSLRSLMGLAAPAAGWLADRIGYRIVMRGLLLLGAVGMFLVGGSWHLGVALAGMILMGLGLFCFAPVLQAYMSARIPYERRARGLGMVEYAWALAGILGLSLSGALIGRFGWRAPFFVLGGSLLVAFLAFGALPAAPARSRPGHVAAVRRTWGWWLWRVRDFLRLESNTRSTWSAIGANALNVFATANIGIVYGSWLNQVYGLGPTQLGTVAVVLGVAELAGSVLVSLVSDHFGKYRTVLSSTAASVLAYVLLPFLNQGLVLVVIGLVLARFTFEVSIVGNISLLSEQVPAQRGKVLALAAAAVVVGVALASVTGPTTFSHWGAWGLGAASAISAFVSMLLVLFWVRDR